MDAVQELLPDFILDFIRNTDGVVYERLGVVIVFTLLCFLVSVYLCRRKASRRSLHSRLDDLNEDLNYHWYHGCISDSKALDRLREGAEKTNGVYLVYCSILCPDEYILLVYYDGQSLEWTISKTLDNKYLLKQGDGRVQKKRTVEELIKIYQGEDGNTLESSKGTTLKLSEKYVPNDIDLHGRYKLWYHGNIPKAMAENLLKIVSYDKTDGKYLVYRPSDSYLPDQYILLVYYLGNFIRLKISKVRDDKFIVGDDHGPDVCRYKTVEKLIDAQKKVGTSSIKSDQGHPVVLKSPVLKSDVPWYHGCIDLESAKDRLRKGANKTNGAYLVYDNSDNLNEYVLSVYYKKKLFHWKIFKAPDNMYVLGEDAPEVSRHLTVKLLIKHYRGLTGTPIRVEKGKVVSLSWSYVERPYLTYN